MTPAPDDRIRRAETEVIGNAVALAMRLQSFARSLERFVQAVRLAEAEVAEQERQRWSGRRAVRRTSKEANDGRQN